MQRAMCLLTNHIGSTPRQPMIGRHRYYPIRLVGKFRFPSRASLRISVKCGEWQWLDPVGPWRVKWGYDGENQCPLQTTPQSTYRIGEEFFYAQWHKPNGQEGDFGGSIWKQLSLLVTYSIACAYNQAVIPVIRWDSWRPGPWPGCSWLGR